MCAILSWRGDFPIGLISGLLSAAESRGKDSTGIAYRSNNQNVIYRQAISARSFIKQNNIPLADARKSRLGIAHCRRASKGMPINNTNAHPFTFGKIIYAHNGKIDNWCELSIELIAKYDELAKNATTVAEQAIFEKTAHWFRNLTTDSMLLGEYITRRNFEPVKGCMGLTWMQRDNVYVMRSAKELVCAKITWEKDKVSHKLTLVASTEEIISNALKGVNGITYSYELVPLEENTIYRLTDDGVESEGAVPVNPENHADNYTSAPVESAPVESAPVEVHPQEEI